MREPNPRVRAREKLELSLDGRQVASIVVGALVVLGVVFVLGLNVGKQIATRRADAGRPGDLEALDRAPVPADAPHDDSITFYDRLPKAKPAAAPPAAAPPAAHPEPVVAAAPVARAEPAPAPAPAAPAPDRPAPVPSPEVAASATPEAPDAPAGGWCVQLSASPTRAEAEKLVARYRSLSPRIEPADVPGKGHFFRVRVGRFGTKEAAERYRKDVARETGAKGFATVCR